MMLDHFLPLVCSTCFLRQPRATSSGVTLLTVVWLLSCQAFQSRKWIIVSLIGQYWSQWLKSKFNERLSLKIKVKVNRRRNSLLMSVSTHEHEYRNTNTHTYIHFYIENLWEVKSQKEQLINRLFLLWILTSMLTLLHKGNI